MKEIWIFNHYASDMYRNKGGRHFWFAQKLQNKGYKVKIFCSNTFHNSNDVIQINNKSLFEVKFLEGIEFIFIKTRSFHGNGKDRVLNMIDFYRNLKKVSKTYLINNSIPDIILASSVHPLTLLAGIQIGKKLNVPNISEVRDLWPEAIFRFGYVKEKSLFGKILEQGEKYLYRNSSALIFTKPGDKDYLIEKKWDKEQGGPIDMNNVFYINNGVDLKEFNNLKINMVYNDSDIDSNKFKVIYTGTIKPVNNIDLILDAAKLLKKEKDIQFLLFGSGSEENRIKNRIEEEDISNVKLKGRVDKKYIPNILGKSNVNLLNYAQSQYNWKRGNSSNKLFEYMASGKPVLSTVKLGYSIIKEKRIGYEISENTAKALAENILQIKRLPSVEYNVMCNNSKEAVKEYDFTILTDKLIQVINEVS